MVKVVKALEMQKRDGLPLAAQERDALASPAYRAALIEEAKAAAALEEIKARRSNARLIVDIWRSLETTYRKVGNYP
jgi:hypothetical protein